MSSWAYIASLQLSQRSNRSLDYGGLKDDLRDPEATNDTQAGPVLKLNLILPEPVVPEPGTFLYSNKSFRGVLMVYAQYIFLCKLYPQFVLRIGLLDQEVELLEESNMYCSGSLQVCQTHSDFQGEVINQYVAKAEGAEQKQVVVGVLAGGGALLLGLGAGILIGFFAR